MRKLSVFLTVSVLTLNLSAQTPKATTSTSSFFDEREATKQAVAKGIKPSEIKGYVQFLKNDFSSKQAISKQVHKHTSAESTHKTIHETVIYLEPNKPMSVGCPNMGFEQYNFSGWMGETGTSSVGPVGGSPYFTSTGTTIVNPSGNNVSVANTANYHTIMTLPAVNPNYISINGYDSLTCKAVGSQTISEIPFVSPFSFDPVSVRMNGINSNYRGCRLKYITTTSSFNQQLSFSYAVVIQNPAGHAINESPYFKVEIKNEATGLPIPGCTSYTFNPQSTVPADSVKQSVINYFGDPTMYRKWQNYTIDLSFLPPGTNVSVNFEVGGCTQGGHWGYAYVDAECGGGPLAYANMCAGSSFATLVAQSGFNSYQWYGPSGLITGATNDTLIENSAVIGATYTVNMNSANGCVTTQTVVLSNTSVQITAINANASCIGGSTGLASVQVSGSNTTYSYTWTNTSNSSIVSTSQIAAGLAPGSYSVLVSTNSCGVASANISVGVTPAFFQSTSKSFCGNAASIAQPGGSNYLWYNGSSIIAAPVGTNDTLYINNAISGDKYTVVYQNAFGCKDSVEYTLNHIIGGNVNITNIKNVCPSNSNGSAVVNAYVSAPYYYFSLQDMSGIISTYTTSSTSFSLTNLAAGNYTTTINDGACIYNNTFVIQTIATNFTMTAGSNNTCLPGDPAQINFTFDSFAPANCGLSSTGSCNSPNNVPLGNGTASNNSVSYPAIYGNFYKNSRHQLLYEAAELLAAGLLPGKISSISFNVSAINGTTSYPDFTISMKCTNDASLASINFDNSGLTQVYYAPLINLNVGLNTYQFANGYEWDGVSNILVDVCNSLSPGFTSNSSTVYTTTSFASVRWMNNDVTPACMSTVASGTSPNRPNVIFENCGSVSPASYTIAVSSNGNMTANYYNDSIIVVPVTTPTADIVYTVTVTNPDGGCTASQTFTVFTNLSAYVTTTNSSCGSCPNGSAQAIVSCGVGPYNYVWSPGGQTTSSVSGLLPGCYTVSITDANLNTTTSNACVTFATKLEETQEASGLSIYPNPSNGVFNLLSATILDKLDIAVINPLGQTVIQESLKQTNHTLIDLSKLSRGIYYLKTNSEIGTTLFKLIVE